MDAKVDTAKAIENEARDCTMSGRSVQLVDPARVPDSTKILHMCNSERLHDCSHAVWALHELACLCSLSALRKSSNGLELAKTC